MNMKKGLLGLLTVVLLGMSIVSAQALTVQPASIAPGLSMLGFYDNENNSGTPEELDPVNRYVYAIQYGWIDIPVQISGVASLNSFQNITSGGTAGTQKSSTSFGAAGKLALMATQGNVPGLFKQQAWPVDVALTVGYLSTNGTFDFSGTEATLTQNDTAFGIDISKPFYQEKLIWIPYFGAGINSQSTVTKAAGVTTVDDTESLTFFDLGVYLGFTPTWWGFAEVGQRQTYADANTRPKDSKDTKFIVGLGYVFPNM